MLVVKARSLCPKFKQPRWTVLFQKVSSVCRLFVDTVHGLIVLLDRLI